jgi:hypothetical protein
MNNWYSALIISYCTEWRKEEGHTYRRRIRNYKVINYVRNYKNTLCILQKKIFIQKKKRKAKKFLSCLCKFRDVKRKKWVAFADLVSWYAYARVCACARPLGAFFLLWNRARYTFIIGTYPYSKCNKIALLEVFDVNTKCYMSFNRVRFNKFHTTRYITAPLDVSR